MALEAAVAILAVLGALLFLFVNKKRDGKLKPPHPPSWPVIGHLHLFDRKQPFVRILASLSDKYGPIMHLQLGVRPVLVISSSSLAKECLTTNDKAFASRSLLSGGKLLGYNYKALSLAPYGSYWRNIRKMCMIQILSASRIESFKRIRVEETSSFIRSLFETCKGEEGTLVNIKPRLSDLAFNIIVRMVASKRVGGPVHSPEVQEANEFKKMIDETFFLVEAFEIGNYLPFLKWLDVQGLTAAMKKLHKKSDVFMQKLIEDHREKRGTSQTQDLIDVLISVTDNNEIPSDNNDAVVKATALTMILAGTGTSSVTIEWGLSALVQHPHILKKVQEELDTQIGRDRLIEETDLDKLKYLQAVVKETFRLYPAVILPHEATEACTVGGYSVPAGTQLLVNAWAIHRDPDVWERPTEFDPDRFLKGGKEIDVKGQDFELIPFGSGRRICPGLSLGLLVVTQTLARLLQSFEWSIPAGTTVDMTEGPGLTMPKAVPLEAIIKPRLPLHLY